MAQVRSRHRFAAVARRILTTSLRTGRVCHVPVPLGRWPLLARSAVPRSCHVARRSLLPRSSRDASSRLRRLFSAGDSVFKSETCRRARPANARKEARVGAAVGLSPSSAVGSGTRCRDVGVRSQEDVAGGVCVPRLRLGDADETADGLRPGGRRHGLRRLPSQTGGPRPAARPCDPAAVAGHRLEPRPQKWLSQTMARSAAAGRGGARSASLTFPQKRLSK